MNLRRLILAVEALATLLIAGVFFLRWNPQVTTYIALASGSAAIIAWLFFQKTMPEVGVLISTWITRNIIENTLGTNVFVFFCVGIFTWCLLKLGTPQEIKIGVKSQVDAVVAPFDVLSSGDKERYYAAQGLSSTVVRAFICSEHPRKLAVLVGVGVEDHFPATPAPIACSVSESKQVETGYVVLGNAKNCCFLVESLGPQPAGAGVHPASFAIRVFGKPKSTYKLRLVLFATEVQTKRNAKPFAGDEFTVTFP